MQFVFTVRTVVMHDLAMPLPFRSSGGGPTYPGCNPHRFRVFTDSGTHTGWTRDVFSFYAYLNKTAGASPFYVMERGGGDVALGDPARCEVTQNPTPAPGWYVKLQFWAYPLPPYHE